MTTAQKIVSTLLEAEDPDFDADDYMSSPDEVSVNPHTALTAQTFYHRTRKYANSKRPMEARRNGATKTWVRQPGKFRIPAKFGLYDCFYIDNDNAHEWTVRPT